MHNAGACVIALCIAMQLTACAGKNAAPGVAASTQWPGNKLHSAVTPVAASTSQSSSDVVNPGHCNDRDIAVQRLVLSMLNEARSSSRRCGATYYGPAPALAWNSTLEGVAHRHSNDMSTRNFFSHKGSNGSTVAERANRAGYNWISIGENIAAGQRHLTTAINGWLDSASHCRNIMNPAFTETAAVCDSSSDSNYQFYWTNVFGQQPGQ